MTMSDELLPLVGRGGIHGVLICAIISVPNGVFELLGVCTGVGQMVEGLEVIRLSEP